MKNNNHNAIPSLCAIVVPLLCQCAYATEKVENSNTADLLTEIIVTAQRHESELMQTPISVSAFTSQQMRDLLLNDVEDYANMVPSLSYQSSPFNRLSLRGVGRFDNSVGIDPGVAIYIDGIYHVDTTALTQLPMNIERVEVLRGPQGTLFGRNATGGAINIITRRPESENTWELSAEVGNSGWRELQLLGIGALTDNLNSKVYLSATQRNGIQDNVTGPDAGSIENRNIELQFDWQLTDAVSFWSKLSHFETDSVPVDSIQLDPWNAQLQNLTQVNLSAQYERAQNGDVNPATVDDPFQFKANPEETHRTQLKGHHDITTKLTYQLSDGELSYLFNNNVGDSQSNNEDMDGTASPSIRIAGDFGLEKRFQSHEIQWLAKADESLRYVAGLYYAKESNTSPYQIRDVLLTWMEQAIPLVNGLPTLPATANPNRFYYQQEASLEARSMAAFGEVIKNVTDDITLTTGLRYSVDRKRGSESQRIYADSVLYLPESTAALLLGNNLSRFALDLSQTPHQGNNSKTWEDISGRLILSYQPNRDSMTWMTLASGYKSGGFRLGSLLDDNSNTEAIESAVFDPENVIMWELGHKATFNNKWQVEVVGFFNDYHDMQQLKDLNVRGLRLSEVINVDAEIYGLEIEGRWLATDNLLFQLVYSYNHSEFSQDFITENRNADDIQEIEAGIFSIPNVNIKGNVTTLTPENKLAFNSLYNIQTKKGDIELGLTVSYTDERYFDITNNPNNRDKAHTRSDVMARWRPIDTQVEFTFSTTNLTNEVYYGSRAYNSVEGVPDSGIRFGAPADSRAYRISFDYRF